MSEVFQRQQKPTLDAALEKAAFMMRVQSLEYRNPRGPHAARMSKKVRQNVAATLDGFALVLENHRARLATPNPERLNAGEPA